MQIWSAALSAAIGWVQDADATFPESKAVETTALQIRR